MTNAEITAQPTVCPRCGKGFRLGEPTSRYDGDVMHLHCAAEAMDNDTFDRDMGFD